MYRKECKLHYFIEHSHSCLAGRKLNFDSIYCYSRAEPVLERTEVLILRIEGPGWKEEIPNGG